MLLSTGNHSSTHCMRWKSHRTDVFATTLMFFFGFPSFDTRSQCCAKENTTRSSRRNKIIATGRCRTPVCGVSRSSNTHTLAVFLPPSSCLVVPCYALLCPCSEVDDGVDDVACEPRVDPSIHPNNDDDEDKNYHSSMGVIVGIANGTVQHVSDRESECLRRMFYG